MTGESRGKQTVQVAGTGYRWCVQVYVTSQEEKICRPHCDPLALGSTGGGAGIEGVGHCKT